MPRKTAFASAGFQTATLCFSLSLSLSLVMCNGYASVNKKAFGRCFFSFFFFAFRPLSTTQGIIHSRLSG